MIILEMKNCDMILTESGTIDKYDYLKGEEILPSNQRQIKK